MAAVHAGKPADKTDLFATIMDLLLFLASVETKLHIPSAAIMHWADSYWQNMPSSYKHPGRAAQVCVGYCMFGCVSYCCMCLQDYQHPNCCCPLHRWTTLPSRMSATGCWGRWMSGWSASRGSPTPPTPRPCVTALRCTRTTCGLPSYWQPRRRYSCLPLHTTCVACATTCVACVLLVYCLRCLCFILLSLLVLYATCADFFCCTVDYRGTLCHPTCSGWCWSLWTWQHSCSPHLTLPQPTPWPPCARCWRLPPQQRSCRTSCTTATCCTPTCCLALPAVQPSPSTAMW